MENKKIIGYRCITNDSYDCFTVGKIYQLCEGKELNDSEAFIDDDGYENGWCGRNHEHFEPVFEEIQNELPEKWYIKGGIELSKYFIEINKIGKTPAYSDYGYYLKNEIWIGNSLSKLRDHMEITLQQYLNSINNKMESKKIYYLKQEVKLNQEIDFNGLKIKVTQDLIDNNPNLFIVEEEKIEDLVLCVKSIATFIKGSIYKINTFFDYFIPIKKINYYKDSDGFIHKFYYTDKGFFNVDGNPCDITEYLTNCHAISNEDVYNKQQEIIKNLPEYVKGKETGKIYKTSYQPNDKIIITECGVNKSCSLDIEHLLNFSTPSTKEEYDKQEELQQLLDEAQKRYPIGTKLSKDCVVSLHLDNKTYLVYRDGSVKVHIGFGLFKVVKRESLDWLPEYKEPVKDLKFYEDKFLLDPYYYGFYTNLKHPNLYYRLILQNIADDLNGDWKANWNDIISNKKYCIRNYNGLFNIDFHNGLDNGEIFFKSEELAKQAINIMGEDKLKIIFSVR